MSARAAKSRVTHMLAYRLGGTICLVPGSACVTRLSAHYRLEERLRSGDAHQNECVVRITEYPRPPN